MVSIACKTTYKQEVLLVFGDVGVKITSGFEVVKGKVSSIQNTSDIDIDGVLGRLGRVFT